MARPRNAPSSAQPASSASKTRRALRETTNTTRPVYNDADHLITDAKPKRGRPKKSQQNADKLVMAGCLGDKDDAAEESTVEVAAKPKRGRPKKSQQSSDELAICGALNKTDDAIAQPSSQVATTTDELTKSDDVPPPTAKPTRRPPRTARKVVHNEAQNKVLEGLKQRMEATARGQKGKQAVAPPGPDAAQPSSDTLIAPKAATSKPEGNNVERSDFSLSPSPPPPGKLSTVQRPRSSMMQPGSALRMQATPMIESSLLALKNFKRRPRQLSMLQMVQQRTASAAPSVGHTAIESTAVEDPSVFDLDVSDEEEDDFAPEAEGTPISKPNRKSSASARGSTKPKANEPKTKKASRKRKSDDIEDSLESVTVKSTKRRRSERARKQIQDDLPAPVTQVPATQSTNREESPQPAGTSEIQVVDSFSTSTPPTEPPSSSEQPLEKEDELLVPSTEPEQQADDEVQDEDDVIPNGTMAEPLSSSPPPVDHSDDDVFADPLTQASPPRPAKKPSRSKTKPMLTATLQSLLPKRRQPLRPRNRKSEYDVEESDSEGETALDASHLDNDEDELGGRLRRQAKTAPKAKSTTSKRGRPSKAASTTSRKPSKAPSRKPSVAPSARKGVKTYGRQSTTSDKENDGEYESPAEGEEDENFTLPEVSMSMEEAATSKEIEEAKRKFAEVDDWDVEFESISAGNHRSSSPQWR